MFSIQSDTMYSNWIYVDDYKHINNFTSTVVQWMDTRWISLKVSLPPGGKIDKVDTETALSLVKVNR